MKKTELSIERDQASIDKDRLIEIYELISGYDSERKDYAPGSIKLSNLFEWLLSADRKDFVTFKELKQRIKHKPRKHKLIVIENPDGRFKIIETVIEKENEKIGSFTIKENLLSWSDIENDGSPMGVADLLRYYSDEHDWRRRAELAISQYKKDFDFSDIENRYKTRIHNHEQESKKLRRHIYAEMSVRYFLVWLVPVALAYGLCLGGRRMIPWLNNLSGWHRIFLVYACTHLVIVVFICAFMPEIVSGSRRRSLGFEDAIGFIFTCGIMPIGLIYGLGRSVGWALKGFGKDSYKSEKYRK